MAGVQMLYITQLTSGGGANLITQQPMKTQNADEETNNNNNVLTRADHQWASSSTLSINSYGPSVVFSCGLVHSMASKWLRAASL